MVLAPRDLVVQVGHVGLDLLQVGLDLLQVAQDLVLPVLAVVGARL